MNPKLPYGWSPKGERIKIFPLRDKKISEDEERRSLDEIQKLTDDEIKKMEEMSKAKEKEVLEIR